MIVQTTADQVRDKEREILRKIIAAKISKDSLESGVIARIAKVEDCEKAKRVINMNLKGIISKAELFCICAVVGLTKEEAIRVLKFFTWEDCRSLFKDPIYKKEWEAIRSCRRSYVELRETFPFNIHAFEETWKNMHERKSSLI